MKKMFIATTIILVISGGFIVYGYLSKIKVREAERQVIIAEQEREKATIDFLKASIDIYYVTNGGYPHRISDMQDVLEEKVKGSYARLETAIDKLKEFRYEIRGDNKTYRISYVNQEGKSVNVEGSYMSEFHNYDN